MSYSSDKASIENQLPISVEFPEDQQQFNREINDRYQKIASNANSKEGGLYVPEEKTNSQQYYNPENPQKFKNVYRLLIDFGALPNTTSKSVVHNISRWNSKFRLTRAYGASTDTDAIESVPIPNDGIMLLINSSSVTITTTSDLSAFTETTVVLEYTKG